jgi:hypothetical protein
MPNNDRIIVLSISISGGDPKCTLIKDMHVDLRSILNHVENFHAHIKIL